MAVGRDVAGSTAAILLALLISIWRLSPTPQGKTANHISLLPGQSTLPPSTTTNSVKCILPNQSVAMLSTKSECHSRLGLVAQN